LGQEKQERRVEFFSHFGFETKKRRNEETKKRRNEETKKRRNEETKKRRNEETKKRKNEETNNKRTNEHTYEMLLHLPAPQFLQPASSVKASLSEYLPPSQSRQLEASGPCCTALYFPATHRKHLYAGIVDVVPTP
jgi:hypothetical protein